MLRGKCLKSFSCINTRIQNVIKSPNYSFDLICSVYFTSSCVEPRTLEWHFELQHWGQRARQFNPSCNNKLLVWYPCSSGLLSMLSSTPPLSSSLCAALLPFSSLFWRIWKRRRWTDSTLEKAKQFWIRNSRGEATGAGVSLAPEQVHIHGWMQMSTFACSIHGFMEAHMENILTKM